MEYCVSKGIFTTCAAKVVLFSVASVCVFVCLSVCLVSQHDSSWTVNRYQEIFRASSCGRKVREAQKWRFNDVLVLVRFDRWIILNSLTDFLYSRLQEAAAESYYYARRLTKCRLSVTTRCIKMPKQQATTKTLPVKRGTQKIFSRMHHATIRNKQSGVCE